eukprot:TRINITY_DN4498_c1_g1_i2.p1 TRINITY_DN4498_c1_g1~~TRINITY_DN4498_c1_g1_i2.p1  ORF type:complete len:890 (+),score=301.20 TRINITY_DN4498_c1_g1_i2:63-2672(+)
MGATESADADDRPESPVSDARTLRMQAEQVFRDAAVGGDGTRGSMKEFLSQEGMTDRLQQQLGFSRFEWQRLWDRLDEAPASRMPLHEWRAMWVDVVGPLGRDRVASDRVFDAIDADGDGSLTRGEIRSYLAEHPEYTKQLEEELGTSDWDALFSRLDADESGSLDRVEFAVLWRENRMDSAVTKPALKAAPRRASTTKPASKPAPKLASVARAVVAAGGAGPPKRTDPALSGATVDELRQELVQLESKRRTHLAVPALQLGRLRAGRASPMASERRTPSPPPKSALQAADVISPRVGDLGSQIGNIVAHTLDVERAALVAEICQERDRLEHELETSQKQTAVLRDELWQLQERQAVELTAKVREVEAALEAAEIERTGRVVVEREMRALSDQLSRVRSDAELELQRVIDEAQLREEDERAARMRAEDEMLMQRDASDALRRGAQQSAEDLSAAHLKIDSLREQLGEERTRSAAQTGELRQLRERVAELDALLSAERSRDAAAPFRLQLADLAAKADHLSESSAEFEQSSRSFAQDRDSWRDRAERAEQQCADLTASSARAAEEADVHAGELRERISALQAKLTEEAAERGRMQGQLEASVSGQQTDRALGAASLAEAEAALAESQLESSALRERMSELEERLFAEAEEKGVVTGKLEEATALAAAAADGREEAAADASGLRARLQEVEQALADAERREEELLQRAAQDPDTTESVRRQKRGIAASLLQEQEQRDRQRDAHLDELEKGLAGLFALQCRVRRVASPAVSPQRPRPMQIDSPRRASLRAAFTRIDRDGNGVLTRAEVIRGLRNDPAIAQLLGVADFQQSDAEGHEKFERLFQSMDSDDSRTITLMEFMAGVSPMLESAQSD